MKTTILATALAFSIFALTNPVPGGKGDDWCDRVFQLRH
jgi:hypothetical protein